jgi:hypothetical protein
LRASRRVGSIVVAGRRSVRPKPLELDKSKEFIMRLIIAAVWLTLGVGSLAAETAPEWAGEKRDLNSGSSRGSATITVDPQSVALGGPFSVDIRFLNSGGGEEFYNPFLGVQTPLPAALAIFSSDHKYLGDLIERDEVSRKMLTAKDWAFVPSLCYVGCVERLTAGYIPATAESASRTLPPGEYYVQMIYFKGFLARNPSILERRQLEDEEKVLQRFAKDFDRAELFRSNVVKVRFTAK